MDRLFVTLIKWRFELTGIVLTVWGMYLRFMCLWKRELWGDEFYSLSCITGPLKPLLWKLGRNGEVTCFPGYYYMTWPFVQIFKTDKWGINIPHILVTLLSFYIFYLLCRRYIRSLIPFTISLLLFVYNDQLIFHAFEFRPYAVLIMASVCIMFFLERLMEGAYQRLQKVFLFLFLALCAVYHPYCLLIMGLCFSYIGIRDRALYQTKLWKDFFKFALISLSVSFLIFLWYSSGASNIEWWFETFQFIANPAVNGVQFTKDVLGNLIGPPLICKLFFLGAVIAIFFSSPNQIRAYFMFAAFFVIIPLELLLLADLLNGYWFVQRQFVWIIPYFALLIGWMWDGAFTRIQSVYFKDRKSL